MNLNLDLSALAAELAAMAKLLDAVEQGRDLSELPTAERPPISKPLSES